MALNELINQIVDVQIRNVTSNTYSRDLNTIAILSKHDVFTAPEVYRVYYSSSAMAEDGFDLNSYAYNAVRTIFSQEITPVKVVVGRVPTSRGNSAYVTALHLLLMIPQGWTWLISDLRDKDTQITLAGIVEENDKMYLAATHDATDALDPLVTTDLASELKARGYSNTAAWFDDFEFGAVAYRAYQSSSAMAIAEPPVLGNLSPKYSEFGDYLGNASPNYSEAALVGRCANGIAGTVNFRLKRLVGITPPASVDTLYKMKTLEDKGYTFAATVEQSIRSYGSTKTASGEWIDVVLAILWLKTNIRERVFATVANSEKLPYETEGAAAIEAAIRSVIAEAQGYNIVADDTPISVATPNVLDLTPAQRNSRVLPNVRFACRLSGAINSTVIRGEVYA